MQAQRQVESQHVVQGHHLARPNQRTQGVMNTSRHASDSLAHHSSGRTMSSDGSRKLKAYVCPLYSCQRLFKRLEHLKRHVRMHTMERPYV